MLMGDIWWKPLIELTKSAKISSKAFSYGAIPDLFLDPRSSMKGIDVLKKQTSGSNYVICAGGRYLKKTSDLVD